MQMKYLDSNYPSDFGVLIACFLESNMPAICKENHKRRAMATQAFVCF